MAKDARIYEDLAAQARGWGYPDVTNATIHNWRKKRLLLPFGRRGVGGVSSAAFARLRRVCELRYGDRIRDLQVIRALIWLEGGVVPTEAAREGLLRFLVRFEAAVVRRLPPALRKAGLRAEKTAEAADSAVDDAAAAIVRQDAVGWGGPVDPLALQDGLAELLAGLLGLRAANRVDYPTLEPAASYLGLDAAHTQGIDGVAPWLSEEPTAALDVAIAEINLPKLRACLEGAAGADLEAARELAVRLLAPTPTVASAMALGYGKGAFGLGSLAALTGEVRLVAVMLALIAPDGMRQVATAAEGQAEAMHATLVLAQRYLAEHPELVEDVEQRGMVAVLKGLEGPIQDPV